MSSRISAVVAVAMVALTACNATVKSESSNATAVSLTPQPSFAATTGEQPQGRLYAVVGDEGGQDGQLYEMRFSPPGLELLAPTKRVSAVGACAGHVVVAAGQQEVGFTDHLQELRNGQFAPLDGLGPIQGFSPRLASDCRVAYTVVDRTVSPLVGELRLWDLKSETGKTLYRGKAGDGPLATTDWGPGDVVAAVRLPAEQAGTLPSGTPVRPPAVVVVRPD